MLSVEKPGGQAGDTEDEHWEIQEGLHGEGGWAGGQARVMEGVGRARIQLRTL